MKPSPVPDFAKRQRPAARELVIGRPPGYTDAEIGGLPALIDRSDPRWPSICSWWKPTPEDLAILNAGGYIQLEAIAERMIPVSLNVVPDEP